MGTVDTRGVKPVHLETGDLAPDFDLPALIGGVKKRFRLSDERGRKNVVLAFYPYNWEAASEQQFVQYQAERDSLQSLHTETVGISVDSIMNTTVWEREIGPFDFPLCSDFWPHGEVAEKYGIFVVDRKGVIVLRKQYGRDQVPALNQVLEVVRRMEQ
jgi:peroxiredoxin